MTRTTTSRCPPRRNPLPDSTNPRLSTAAAASAQACRRRRRAPRSKSATTAAHEEAATARAPRCHARAAGTSSHSRRPRGAGRRRNTPHSHRCLSVASGASRHCRRLLRRRNRSSPPQGPSTTCAAEATAQAAGSANTCSSRVRRCLLCRAGTMCRKAAMPATIRLLLRLRLSPPPPPPLLLPSRRPPLQVAEPSAGARALRPR